MWHSLISQQWWVEKITITFVYIWITLIARHNKKKCQVPSYLFFYFLDIYLIFRYLIISFLMAVSVQLCSRFYVWDFQHYCNRKQLFSMSRYRGVMVSRAENNLWMLYSFIWNRTIGQFGQKWIYHIPSKGIKQFWYGQYIILPFRLNLANKKENISHYLIYFLGFVGFKKVKMIRTGNLRNKPKRKNLS